MAPKGFPQKVSTFKIFVSNLPSGLKNEDVARMFEPYGRVVESEVFKGNFAFVHMEDDCNGRQAIHELNGLDVDGNVLSVVQSKNVQGPKIPTMKLAVKNLPPGLAAGELRNLFTKYGYILEAEIRGPQGHVLLEATGDIRSAINEVSGHQIGGQVLKVEAVTGHINNNNSAPSKPKPGKRKELMPGPYGRKPGPPPAYMTPAPPPHGNFGPYPRRPGPPPMPPRLGMRPGPGPRPFFRPPPPPPQQEFSQDYDYNYDNDGGPSGGFYGDNYEQPFFEQPSRRPPHPNFMQNNFDNSYKTHQDNQPYNGGNNRRNFLPPTARIPRERHGPPPPLAEPVYNEDSYFTQDDVFPPPRRNINEYEEEFVAPPFGHPGKRPPPPLMGGPDIHQPEPHLQALLKRTAKVTKYGKIVVNGAEESPAKKKRGVRGGVQVRARKSKQGLPSLMDPIPGTVTPAGGQPYTSGYNPAAVPSGPAPPLMGINSGPKQPRPLMHFRQQRPSAAGIPPPPPSVRPLMRPPLPPQMQPGSKQSLLALYHESKRSLPQPQQPSHMMMPMPTVKHEQKQEIDFTADIEIA